MKYLDTNRFVAPGTPGTPGIAEFECELEDGVLGLSNRQPTLHQPSMQGVTNYYHDRINKTKEPPKRVFQRLSSTYVKALVDIFSKCQDDEGMRWFFSAPYLEFDVENNVTILSAQFMNQLQWTPTNEYFYVPEELKSYTNPPDASVMLMSIPAIRGWCDDHDGIKRCIAEDNILKSRKVEKRSNKLK